MLPSRSSLETILRRCGIDLDTAQYDALWTYHRLLREANAELNLTRIHNFENMVLKHYADSLLVLDREELPSPLLDMGTGPGLPGIPLKIARPGVRMILAEPRGARADFLGEVVTRLGLREVEVYAGKIGPRFAGPVAGVITRAVASIPETLDRVANALEVGGRMLFMKGPECDPEIDEASRTHAGSYRMVADHAYEIPGTPHRRRLVVYERLAGRVVSDPAAAEAEAVAAERAHPGPVRDVTSEANPTFKLCRDLLGGRGIRKHGRALLAGPRTVAEVLDAAPGQVEGWLTGDDATPPPR